MVEDFLFVTEDYDRFGDMQAEPRCLADLDRGYHPDPRWLVKLVSAEAGGGRISKAELDILARHPDATALVISGLDQATFEYLITRYGAQFQAIEFWKCPRITDLSPLEDLPGLRLAGFYWNQRVTRLWNLARNPGLTGLSFEDFTRLHDLSDLRAGTSLRELAFGDALHSTSVFDSLEPLAGLDGLQTLDFSARRIDDGRIEPIGNLTGLTSLTFPTNMFTTRQVAWLRARLPESVRSDALAPLVQYEMWPAGDEDATDILLVGKRKPWLNSTRHAARIQKHVDEFWQMVAEFRRDPALTP